MSRRRIDPLNVLVWLGLIPGVIALSVLTLAYLAVGVTQ